jgi:hypothetical protein
MPCDYFQNGVPGDCWYHRSGSVTVRCAATLCGSRAVQNMHPECWWQCSHQHNNGAELPSGPTCMPWPGGATAAVDKADYVLATTYGGRVPRLALRQLHCHVTHAPSVNDILFRSMGDTCLISHLSFHGRSGGCGGSPLSEPLSKAAHGASWALSHGVGGGRCWNWSAASASSIDTVRNNALVPLVPRHRPRLGSVRAVVVNAAAAAVIVSGAFVFKDTYRRTELSAGVLVPTPNNGTDSMSWASAGRHSAAALSIILPPSCASPALSCVLLPWLGT